jgi:hypothetical protein
LGAVQLLLGEPRFGAGEIYIRGEALRHLALDERPMTARVWPSPLHCPASPRTRATMPLLRQPTRRLVARAASGPGRGE